MPNTLLIVALSLAAALAFATSSALKHVSAGQIPDARGLQPRRLAAFVRATLIHRWWLGGMVCDTAGVGCQLFALHLGALSVVQPLLLTSLVFALLIRGRFSDHGLTTRRLVWALVLVGALAASLFLATDTVGATAEAARPGPAGIAAAVGAFVVVVCVAASRRYAGRAAGPLLLGIAVGLIYAATAALLKACGAIAAHGVWSLLTSWPLYAIIALGGAGLLLAQLTFQAGALSAGLAATATVDPLASVAVGVFVYGEHLRSGGLVQIFLPALLIVLVVAVVQLGRTSQGERSTVAMVSEPG